MTPEEWQRVKAAFDAALERNPIQPVAGKRRERPASDSGGLRHRATHHVRTVVRELVRALLVIEAENPTRGLDIRATAEVRERLRAAAREGVAVIVYSTDLDEVLELGERVLVVHRGRVSEAPPGPDRRVVGGMMLGLGTA